MDRTMHAHGIAGYAAAAARTSVAQGLGRDWSFVASPCENSAFAMAITTNKRPPRRLGQRTT